nr:hypothetical protein [Tanacetum cinerariifolium]
MTTVTKNATKEKAPNEAETAPRINILDFCEEHYADILPVIDRIRRDKRREVHTGLDFGEKSRKSQKMREDSQTRALKPCLQDTVTHQKGLKYEIACETAMEMCDIC